VAGGTAIDSAYRRVFAADCIESRRGDRGGMERIEPTPEPPDRDGVPRTLLAFTCAVLFVVAEVVVLSLVETAWAVVFAIASIVALLVVVLWAIELDIRPRAARRPEVRGAPVRTSPPATWSGPPGHRRVLLVASERMGVAALTPLVDVFDATFQRRRWRLSCDNGSTRSVPAIDWACCGGRCRRSQMDTGISSATFATSQPQLCRRET